jgi:electron transfer flavoprotein beta subunit
MSADAAAGPTIAVALKSVDLRPDVDALTGVVTTDGRWAGLSDADEAALETALGLAERWAGTVVAVGAGPSNVDAVLRQALAAGAARAVRVDLPAEAPSTSVARALGEVVTDLGATWVLCGAHSLDRGSGSVPAFLAHHLAAAQALGLVSVEAEAEGEVEAEGDPATPAAVVTRRLDQARRERLRVVGPAVLSVEGSVARLRRASLAAALRSESAEIEVTSPSVATAPGAATAPTTRRAYRPRARALDAPHGSTLQRILELTDAATPRTPPRLVELDPEAAAAEILQQLREWGELGDDPA